MSGVVQEAAIAPTSPTAEPSYHKLRFYRGPHPLRHQFNRTRTFSGYRNKNLAVHRGIQTLGINPDGRCDQFLDILVALTVLDNPRSLRHLLQVCVLGTVEPELEPGSLS